LLASPKPLLLTYHRIENITAALDTRVATGLYIVQSTHEPTCFRAGAGGVNGDTSTLSNRLKQHRSNPPNRHDINWTEYHRRWNIVWAVQFSKCDRLTGRLCESLLIGELATRFHFIPEATGSGFFSEATTVEEITEFAISLEPRLQAIIERQNDRPPLRPWIKGTSPGLPSRYLD
jgi:hypothetical protein